MFILVRGFRTYSHVRRHRKVSILGMVLPIFIGFTIVYCTDDGWHSSIGWAAISHIPCFDHGTYDFSFSVVVMCFFVTCRVLPWFRWSCRKFDKRPRMKWSFTLLKSGPWTMRTRRFCQNVTFFNCSLDNTLPPNREAHQSSLCMGIIDL